MTIGEKIQYIRMYRNLTRDTLADMTGISRTSIYNYETNKRDMTIDVLEKITSTLKIPISLIFNSRDTDDLIFKDNVRIHYAQLEREYPEHSQSCERSRIDGDVNTLVSEEDYETMYSKNFSRLLEWKISKLNTEYEFFELVLNWYSVINKNTTLNKEDIEELSIMFSRMLSLKCSENKLMSILGKHPHDAESYDIIRQVSESKIRPDLSQSKQMMELYKLQSLMDEQMDD